MDFMCLSGSSHDPYKSMLGKVVMLKQKSYKIRDQTLRSWNRAQDRIELKK